MALEKDSLTENNSENLRPPLSQMLIYACGQLGWSMTIFGPTTLLVYFYLPSEKNSGDSFPAFLPQILIFGFFTVVGLLSFLGRIVDAFSDPIVAGISDRFKSRFGKRKTLFGLALVPFSLSSFLVFYPMFEPGSVYNVYWLSVFLVLFYLSFTTYVIPYSALISELGHNPKDRLLISSLISAFWAIGILAFSSIYAFQNYFQSSMPKLEAFQYALLLLIAMGAVFLLIPVLFLNENKYAVQQSQVTSFGSSLRNVLKNSNFRTYIFSDLMYWLSITFILSGLSFYVTLIFGFEVHYTSIFLAIAFVASFVCYYPINLLVNRFGKKKMLMAAFICTGFVFLLMFLTDILPIPRIFIFTAIGIIVAFPLATFGIIPSALIADIIHIEEHKTGINQSGMYYAVRNFMMKIGISVANLLFPSLLMFGNSKENYFGVKLTVLVAIAFCMTGFLIFRRFKEPPSIE